LAGWNKLTPDQLFDRHWVMTLVETVVAELQRQSTREGKEKIFEVLKPFLTKGQWRMARS